MLKPVISDLYMFMHACAWVCVCVRVCKISYQNAWELDVQKYSFMHDTHYRLFPNNICSNNREAPQEDSRSRRKTNSHSLGFSYVSLRTSCHSCVLTSMVRWQNNVRSSSRCVILQSTPTGWTQTEGNILFWKCSLKAWVSPQNG